MSPAHASPPKEVRIIGGQWKRTKLPVLDKPGLRPTPDRVRETLFNWLGQELDGWRCLDVFAGTGSLGFEAASRGARHVLLVEQDPELVARMRGLQAKLGSSALEIRRGNGVSVLSSAANGDWDLVFLDPPFDANLWDKALAAAKQAVRPAGFVYLEAPQPWTDERVQPYGFDRERHVRAGAVHAHLLRRVA
jgi:16S rRNA (guanine(966)-N(2))-methyltransferase RsmD